MYPKDYLNKEDSEAVYFFSSPFDPLNNWSANTVKTQGIEFKTLEHAYHYQKFIDNYPGIAKEILEAPSPWAAMQIARQHRDRTRKDWDNIKVDVMRRLIKLKYEQNKDVQEALKKTGKRTIVENSPVDSFWGIGRDGKGQNMTGQIWMKLRESKI